MIASYEERMCQTRATCHRTPVATRPNKGSPIREQRSLKAGEFSIGSGGSKEVWKTQEVSVNDDYKH